MNQYEEANQEFWWVLSLSCQTIFFRVVFSYQAKTRRFFTGTTPPFIALVISTSVATVQKGNLHLGRVAKAKFHMLLRHRWAMLGSCFQGQAGPILGTQFFDNPSVDVWAKSLDRLMELWALPFAGVQHDHELPGRRSATRQPQSLGKPLFRPPASKA